VIEQSECSPTEPLPQNHTRLQNERRNMMANPQMQTMMRNSMMANGNDMKKAVAINGQRQL